MHICQVVASWEYGGLEKHVIELSNTLSKQHQVTVIAHPQMQQYFAPDVRVITVDFSQSRWSPRLYWQLTQILGQLQPDIIHAQANKAALLIARLRRWLPPGIRYVATLHNQKGSTTMFESYDRVIAVSGRIAALIKQAPVTVIYNGITPVAQTAIDRGALAARFALDHHRPIWLAVGRLVDAKGFDLLITAAAQARVQVVIVGDGPLREALAQQIRETGAEVTLAGFCPDAATLIAAADGLVISSRYEGGPYTLPEALLARVAVIATDVGMVSEFLPSACIVPVGDTAALAAKLQWAATQPDAVAALLEDVWRKAEQHLTLEAMVQQTEAIYRQVLA